MDYRITFKDGHLLELPYGLSAQERGDRLDAEEKDHGPVTSFCLIAKPDIAQVGVTPQQP